MSYKKINMTMKNYNVKEDEAFILFYNGKNLTKNSIKKYTHCLKNYTNYHQLTLAELLEEADQEEENIARLSKRTIRKRLINFRAHLIKEKNYSASSITTNINCAKAFYRFNGIEIPEIPQSKLPKSPDDAIEFEDLPTRNVIKTAIEGTKLNKHKALFLFSFTTGSARMELTNFTFQQFLDGLKPYTNNAKTPQDIIEQLDGKCEEKETIPIFKMRRQKTEYYYNTATTPECVQFMIDYMKKEGQNLKPEDKFFQLSEWGVSTAFKLINEKFNWGKRGTRDYFSSHRIRALHASLIEDKNLANYLEGRRPDAITQAYFKRDKNRIREKYKKHMHKFTIYAKYQVMINSEAYKQIKEELETVNKENREKDKIIAELRKEMRELKQDVNTIKESRISQDNAITDHIENLHKEGKIEKDEVIPLIQIARSKMNPQTFKGTEEELEELTNKARIELSFGKTSKEEQVDNFKTQIAKNTEEFNEDIRIYRIILKKLDERNIIDLIEDPEKSIEQIKSKIKLAIKLGTLTIKYNKLTPEDIGITADMKLTPEEIKLKLEEIKLKLKNIELTPEDIESIPEDIELTPEDDEKINEIIYETLTKNT